MTQFRIPPPDWRPPGITGPLPRPYEPGGPLGDQVLRRLDRAYRVDLIKTARDLERQGRWREAEIVAQNLLDDRLSAPSYHLVIERRNLKSPGGAPE